MGWPGLYDASRPRSVTAVTPAQAHPGATPATRGLPLRPGRRTGSCRRSGAVRGESRALPARPGIPVQATSRHVPSEVVPRLPRAGLPIVSRPPGTASRRVDRLARKCRKPPARSRLRSATRRRPGRPGQISMRTVKWFTAMPPEIEYIGQAADPNIPLETTPRRDGAVEIERCRSGKTEIQCQGYP